MRGSRVASKDKKFHFTKRDIEKLPAPVDKKQVYYRDSGCSGLALSVTRAGAKSFHMYRWVDGEPRRQFLGKFPDLTVEEARGKAAEVNSEIAKGGNPFDDKPSGRIDLTLKAAFDKYIEDHAKQKRKTWEVMKKNFARDATSLADLKLSEITTDDANKIHADMQNNSGPYAANRMIQLLRAVFNKAIKWKKTPVKDNPFAEVTLSKEHPRDRFLSDDEAARLLQVLAKEKGDIADFLMLALFTGARRTSLLSCRWEHVNLAAGTLRSSMGKTATARLYRWVLVRLGSSKRERNSGVVTLSFQARG